MRAAQVTACSAGLWMCFFVGLSSICAGVLSLVNYTRRYASERERERRGWAEPRRWVWSCLWLSFNAQSLLASLAPSARRRLNACQNRNERENYILFKSLVVKKCNILPLFGSLRCFIFPLSRGSSSINGPVGPWCAPPGSDCGRWLLFVSLRGFAGSGQRWWLWSLLRHEHRFNRRMVLR